MSNEPFYFMVVKGKFNELKPFELFTGGEASPNPSYPQEVESVKAYNMINIPREFKVFDKFYLYPINIKKGTYTLYVKDINTDGANNFSILFADAKGTYQEIVAKKEQHYYTITLIRDYERMQIYPQTSTENSKGKTTTFYDLMLYEGTEPKPYQQYQQIKIKQNGKNLFDIGNNINDYFQTTKDGEIIDNYKNTTSTIKIEKNKLQVLTYNNVGYKWLSKWIDLKPNTNYTLSGTITTGIKIIGFNSKDLETKGERLAYIDTINQRPPKTFNSGNYKYYALGFYPRDIGNYFENIQIEKGTQPTSYEPYKEVLYPLHLGDIELNKIGDSEDYFYKDLVSGKWYLVNKFFNYIFTGEESFNYFQTNEEYSRTKAPLDIPSPKGYDNYSNGISNYFIKSNFITISKLKGNLVCAWNNAGERRIDFSINKKYLKTNDILGFREFFKDKKASGNPVKVWYELETPIETEIINPELIEDLERLYNCKTFKPTTILTNNSIAIMKLDYIADTQTYIDNKFKQMTAQIKENTPMTIPLIEEKPRQEDKTMLE